jgi:hypothetical protein
MNFLEGLSSDDLDIVKRALRATVEDDFFPDWEFQTLIGVDRNTVKKVLETFPLQTVDYEEFFCAVFGSMGNLLGYPHGMDEELATYLPEGRSIIRRTLDRLNELVA